ncbi:DUF1801 domain-containing protein [Nocardioides sp.]|uniref:DUF1801 domain-containing protein n=1 Tax=Nocardioides sp. TaxID=35761 RepID=UPI003568598E
MHSDAPTPEAYLAELPDERRAAISRVRDVVNEHLPDGYAEQIEWGMISWVVPLSRCPKTYNGKPLAYISLASQKNHMALYLMGLYSDDAALAWLRQEYAERGLRLDMGKSCLRFRKLEDLPLDVIGQVVAMVGVDELISRHETVHRR